MSSDIPTVVTLLAQARAAHAAAGETLAKLEGLLATEAKKAARKIAKKAKAASESAPADLKPRGAWQAFLHGDPTPADGGPPVLPAKERYAAEYEAYERTLPHKRGAPFNFASLASDASEGDPIGVPKPKQGEEVEGESDEAYAERLADWRETVNSLLSVAADSKGSPLATHWSVNAAAEYAEHEARYAAMAEARSASGASSSKSKRPKLTEEEKLERREAKKAETKARNDAKTAALKAEREAAKAAKAKAKPAAKAPAVVKNAAIPAKTPVKAAPAPAPAPKAPAAPVKAKVVAKAPPTPKAKAAPKAAALEAASDSDSSDSDSSSDEEAPVLVAPKAKAKAVAKPKAAKAAPPPPPVEEGPRLGSQDRGQLPLRDHGQSGRARRIHRPP